MLGDPKLSDQEFLVTQHVEQWHLAHHRPEQVRTLRERRPHEQAAVTATLYGQEQETAHSLCRIPIPLPGSPHPRGSVPRTRGESRRNRGPEEMGPKRPAKPIHRALLRMLSLEPLPEYPPRI